MTLPVKNNTNNENTNNNSTNNKNTNANNTKNQHKKSEKCALNFGDEICYIDPYIANITYSRGYQCEDKVKALIASSQTCDMTVNFIHQCSQEPAKITYLNVDNDDNVLSFILIHRTDFDPAQKHNHPFVIDYV